MAKHSFNSNPWYKWLHRPLVETLDRTKLPPLTVNGKPLGLPAVEKILTALQTEDVQVCLMLRNHISYEERVAFIDSLVIAWKANGGAHIDAWALRSMILLGKKSWHMDAVMLVRRARRAILGDTEENRGDHARIALNLILALLGDDHPFGKFYMLYFATVNQIIYGHRRLYRRVEKQCAQAHISVSDLTDICAPKVELHGKTFVYQKRRYTLVMTEELDVGLRDRHGRLRYSLPSAKTSADALLIKQWRFTRRLVKDVRALYSIYFERTMSNQRRWSYADFERNFLKHPLLRFLCMRLVWGMFEGNRFVGAFAIAPDLTFFDRSNSGVKVPPNVSVGVLHPLHFDESERTAWRELLDDYDISPPFLQITRPVYHPLPVELRDYTIERYIDQAIPNESHYFRKLRRFGWEYSAKLKRWIRRFEGTGQQAVLTENPDPHLMPSIHFQYIDQPDERLPLDLVNLIAFSETLYDLSRIQNA